MTQVAIYNEELARAGAPPLLGRAGLTLVGPTLMAHGTEEQRARWMPRILGADDVWCQLFSEPGAGSDLASLSTRAPKSGGVYRVTGQKVWSSYATFADMGIALVRTDPNAAPHKGISMLAIPMDAKGVDVRPLRQMTGEYEFNEVFFDEVEVPVENLIGPENEGWRVANTTLGNERGGSFVWKEQVLLEAANERLDRGVHARAGSPTTRVCVNDSRGRGSTSRSSGSTTRARSTALERGEEIGAESSIVKLFWAGASQRLYDTATTVLGPGALLTADDPGAVDGGRWARGLLSTRANSIMGGTSEIQRNILGERVLGCPREPTSDADDRSTIARPARLRRSARPRRPGALRARRVSARRVDAAARRGAGRAHRGARVTSRSGRSRGTPTSWRSRASRTRFSSEYGITLARAEQPVMKMPDMVVMLDPPRHVPMRRVVSGRFTPKAVRARQDDVDRMGTEILDGAVTGGDGGECDFVERIAAPLPLAVIAWMLGLPRDDWALLFRLSNEVIGSNDPGVPRDRARARRRRSGARVVSSTPTSRS